MSNNTNWYYYKCDSNKCKLLMCDDCSIVYKINVIYLQIHKKIKENSYNDNPNNKLKLESMTKRLIETMNEYNNNDIIIAKVEIYITNFGLISSLKLGNGL